jgi:hypothetical protein
MLALGLIAFSLAPSLRAALPILFLLGVAQIACVASMNTTLQLAVRDAMRGRVMSMLSFALFGLSTLGSLLLGALGDRIGVTSAIRIGGIVIVAAVAVLAVRSPAIFRSIPPAEHPRP